MVVLSCPTKACSSGKHLNETFTHKYLPTTSSTSIWVRFLQSPSRHQIAYYRPRLYPLPRSRTRSRLHPRPQLRPREEVAMASTRRTALPPTEDERNHYYWGLPSLPKLVARSNATDITWEMKVEKDLKALSPTGRHEVVNLWNDTFGPLRRDILEALEGTACNAIDILRLGYARDGKNETHKHGPITFFLSVDPDSTTWEQGYATVTNCKKILERHHVVDVHCEMMESRLHFATLPSPTVPSAPPPPTVSSAPPPPTASSAPPGAPPLTSSLLEAQFPAEADVEALTSACIGVGVASAALPDGGGTKGLYFRKQNDLDGPVYVMTCRHVVFDLHTDDGKRYEYDESKPRLAVIQPDNLSLQKEQDKLRSAVEGEIADRRRIINTITKRCDYNPPPERLAPLQTEIEDLMTTLETRLQHTSLFEPEEMRIFGHVAFAPEYGTYSLGSPGGERANCCLSDWALIELHAKKHETPLRNLTNHVFVGRSSNTELRYAREEAPAFCEELDSEISTLQLQNVAIPVEDMFSPKRCNSAGDLVTMVAMHGKATGFSVGFANMAKSVLRRLERRGDVNDVYTVETWCVVGRRNRRDEGVPGMRRDFSTCEDSGATVFDLEGHIGGMLTAGSSLNGSYHDKSYVTPLEWILDDADRQGFKLCLV